jgi:glycosyltransferase involved in cell wall biosynthesis
VLAAGQSADVTLVLEGTYPFVTGGVSSWMHQIVSGLPDIRFALVFLGGNADSYERLRYTLPKNVVHLEEHYLGDVPRFQRLTAKRGDLEFYRMNRELHDAFAVKGDLHGRIEVMLERLVGALLDDPARHEHDFLSSESAWDEIAARYEASAKSRSFLEYFWTVRSMHAPLFKLARVAASLPPSRSFHVVSTGFGGFLGALAQKRQHRPLVLTEHGIYSKERGIELLQAGWIHDDEHESDEDSHGIGFFRQMWIRFFEALGRLSYAAANPIISLYEGNRQRQVRDGADTSRTLIVPNGIDLARYAALRSKRERRIPPVLGLIGRVVPIKDIKTFIRTMRAVVSELPEAEGWIVGPEDEDKSYAEECHHLVRSLSLENTVKFLGFQKVDDILPRLGLNVLTSISEAQPLVVLEGFAAGVPCVSTDVGCARELVHGATPEDQCYGSAGAVVSIANPEATARAALSLLGDPRRWHAAQTAGIARVEKLYTQEVMLARYRSIYETALATGREVQAPNAPALHPS